MDEPVSRTRKDPRNSTDSDDDEAEDPTKDRSDAGATFFVQVSTTVAFRVFPMAEGSSELLWGSLPHRGVGKDCR